jgi:hypothetical protein
MSTRTLRIREGHVMGKGMTKRDIRETAISGPKWIPGSRFVSVRRCATGCDYCPRWPKGSHWIYIVEEPE